MKPAGEGEFRLATMGSMGEFRPLERVRLTANLDCMSSSQSDRNRRMRTRMSGGVGPGS
jgi:hypothetical protein